MLAFGCGQAVGIARVPLGLPPRGGSASLRGFGRWRGDGSHVSRPSSIWYLVQPNRPCPVPQARSLRAAATGRSAAIVPHRGLAPKAVQRRVRLARPRPWGSPGRGGPRFLRLGSRGAGLLPRKPHPLGVRMALNLTRASPVGSTSNRSVAPLEPASLACGSMPSPLRRVAGPARSPWPRGGHR